MHIRITTNAKKRILIAVSILFVIILACFIYISVLLNSSTIYKGIAIEGCNVSGMNTEEAEEAVRKLLNDNYSSGNLVIRYNNQEQKYGFEEISFGFLVNSAVNKAYETGRTGNLLNKLKEISSAAINGKSYEIEEHYDEEKAVKLLMKIKLLAEKPAKNAQITYKAGEFTTSGDEPGYIMDIDTNRKLLENQIKARKFGNIILKVNEIMPEITLEKINNIDSVLSTFSTKFNSADINRSYNIKLACSKINDIILMPGEIFSMNEALGPRTTENGYREAPIIFKNELVPGTGGGICQVTTTLYDAVLMSCLKVVERAHHSMTLGYVKPGQDATISEGSIDFRFKNNMDYPLLINAEVNKNTIFVRILGKSSKERRVVKLVSEIIEEYPPIEEILVDATLQKGETVVVRESKRGLKSALYREIYDDGNKLLSREKISEDIYKPINGQILIGPE